MFLTFVTILPLTIPANYRLSSQFLSVGLKVDVRVWYKVSVRFGIINNTKMYGLIFLLVGLKVRVLHYVILYCGRLLIISHKKIQ